MLGVGDEKQVFGTISGTILDENDQIVSEPTSVTLFTGANVAMTLSDTSDGTYRFENIPAGDFTFASRDEVYGRRAFGMGTITFGASDAVVDLKFLGAGDIVGTVRDHEGRPCECAYVRAGPSGADEQSRATLTDSAGRFAFSGLPLGETIDGNWNPMAC